MGTSILPLGDAMVALAKRRWVPEACDTFIQGLAGDTSWRDTIGAAIATDEAVALNRAIHERDCFNLNVMNPKAEAALASGLGSRPSLGYPGDKYEMGLEGVERIEVIAAELAAEIFDAKYAELRVPSGAIANLYAFMTSAQAGGRIIAPPPAIGGQVTHHLVGCAGRYGLEIHPALSADNYTIDVEALRLMAKKLRPQIITVGSSLNLFRIQCGTFVQCLTRSGRSFCSMPPIFAE
jgi:glycine hydroxymethyltransferase